MVARPDDPLFGRRMAGIFGGTTPFKDIDSPFPAFPELSSRFSFNARWPTCRARSDPLLNVGHGIPDCRAKLAKLRANAAVPPPAECREADCQQFSKPLFIYERSHLDSSP